MAAPVEVPYTRVIVPVGGNDSEFVAQEHAAGIAGALGLPLVAVHVESPGRRAPADLWRYVDKAAARWRAEVQHIHLDGTDVADALLAEAQGSDLIVIGTERIGSGYKLGSVGQRLTLEAPGPVTVVRLE